jgi:hypothetical protein
MTMTPELYKEVVLRRDVPEQGLKAGDVAMLVELVPGPPGQPQGAVLEVFNGIGESIYVTSVSVEDVEPLTANEVFNVRRLSRAG